MKKMLLGLSVVVLFTLAGAPVALAGGHEYRGTGSALCPSITGKLGLSEDQQKKVDSLKQKVDKQTAPDIAKLKSAKEALQALWKAQKPNRKALLAKQSQIYNIKQKLETAKVDAHLELLKILTAEQKTTLEKELQAGYWCQGHLEGCQCPKCKQKTEAVVQTAKDSGCQSCPQKECPYHKK